MIYWHVEKKSVCIYSQLKNVAGSEVPQGCSEKGKIVFNLACEEDKS